MRQNLPMSCEGEGAFIQGTRARRERSTGGRVSKEERTRPSALVFSRRQSPHGVTGQRAAEASLALRRPGGPPGEPRFPFQRQRAPGHRSPSCTRLPSANGTRDKQARMRQSEVTQGWEVLVAGPPRIWGLAEHRLERWELHGRGGERRGPARQEGRGRGGSSCGTGRQRSPWDTLVFLVKQVAH